MRAVFALCEGAHDVAFVRRSLLAHGRGRLLDSTIEALPTPLGAPAEPGGAQTPSGSLIARHYARRRLGETKLGPAGHAPPPIFECVIVDEERGLAYVLLRCHGDPTRDACLELIDDIVTAFDPLISSKADLNGFALGFIVDADLGLDHALDRIRSRCGRLCASGALDHRRWSPGRDSPIGCFVWHDAKSRSGTLETHAEPIFAAALGDRWAKASAYIDDPTLPTLAGHRRIKGIATAAIQFDRPGSPLSLAFHHELIPGEHFQRSAASQQLVDFLATPFATA